jgi:hypothetical protein
MGVEESFQIALSAGMLAVGFALMSKVVLGESQYRER